VSVSLRCLGCLLAALLISAVVHLALAAALMWDASGQAPAEPAALEVGVTLAMFEDPGPPGGAQEAPAEATPPTAEPEPEPEPEQAAEAASPPEPEPVPVPEVLPEPLPEVVSRPAPKPQSKPRPKPKPAEAPKVATDRPRPVRAQPIVASPVAVAAPVAAGSGDGGGGAARGPGGAPVASLEGEYLRGLQKAIVRNRFYPPGAKREDVKGVVTVAFTVQGDGRLGDIRVAKGSGFEVLDQAAVETLRRLGSYRPIPAGIGRSRWPVRVPIVFDLR
jgi:protein TonB